VLHRVTTLHPPPQEEATVRDRGEDADGRLLLLPWFRERVPSRPESVERNRVVFRVGEFFALGEQLFRLVRSVCHLPPRNKAARQ